MNRISELIKQEILSRLINNYVPFNGQQKRVTRFVQWWNKGIEFNDDFDLSQVPINGPIQTSVKLSLWCFIEAFGAEKKVNIVAYFCPIIISFQDANYHVNCSYASFSRYEVG
jgi:hypothetical protein